MKKLLLTITLILGTSSLAQAGILIEPYVGFSTASQNVTQTDGADASSKTEGLAYGGRLGYTFPILLWLAADATMQGDTDIKYDRTGFTPAQGSRTAYGLTLGMDLPILLRVWGGYIIDDSVEVKTASANNKFTGTGTKLGVGFTGLPFVSINLEYSMSKYTKASGPSFTGTTTFESTYTKFENNVLLVSVSLPIDL